MMSRPPGRGQDHRRRHRCMRPAAIAYGVCPYLPLTVAIVSGYIIYVGVVLVSAMSYGDNRIMHLFGWLVLCFAALSAWCCQSLDRPSASISAIQVSCRSWMGCRPHHRRQHRFGHFRRLRVCLGRGCNPSLRPKKFYYLIPFVCFYNYINVKI